MSAEKTITVNGVKLTPGQLRAVLGHAFYRNTLGADLDTPDGCNQAATCAVDVLQVLRRGSVDPAQMHEHDRFELSHVPLGVMH